MKELGSGIAYNTHNITSLIRTLKYVPDILQTEEAFTVEEYKHTHIRLHQISVNLENFRFWDQICPKNMNENNFEKINIKTVLSIWQCFPVPNFS